MISLELNHIISYVPIGIALLAILTLILILTLHYGLAKPLKSFIGIMNSTNTRDVKYRLPYHRPDELGMIAKAYGCRSYGTTSDPFSIRRLGDFKRQKRPICGSYLAAKQNKQPQKASL